MDLIHSAGRLLGQECKAKGAHVLLGPTINIQRAPLGGRGFESYSEDPYLSGMMASEYCQGVQEEDILTTPKHYVCNDQDNDRMGVNSIVTERALREIYLMPFMLAVKNAKPAAIMTAYNKLNGTHVCESSEMLAILRKEWHWDGLVMSDWGGTYSTSDAIVAGLDLEMPGPTLWRGRALSHALIAKKVLPHVLDDRVRNVLNLVKSSSKSDIPEEAKERTLNRPEDQGLLRRLAAESVVLLKNEHDILPFSKDKTVAVIGPNTWVATYSGGGSATLLPYYTVKPLEGVSAKAKDVRFAQGTYGHKDLPLLGERLRTPDGHVGFIFKAYDQPVGAPDRKKLDCLHLTNSAIFLIDYVVPNHPSSVYYVDVEGLFTPEESGTYDFGLMVQGTGRLFVDGKLVVDNTENQRPGTAFFGASTAEEIGSVDMDAGQSYNILIEFGTAPTAKGPLGSQISFGAGGLRIAGCLRIDIPKAIDAAVQLAREVDQVVLFAGLNSDWESESFDRPTMNLPPHSDDLINKVLAANPNAVVVIQSGTPVTMPWVDRAKALVHAWYGGNETGNGIADVLFGDLNPSGKLSLSFPRRLSDNPAYLNWGSEGGRVLYGEDLYVGYRYYDKVERPPLFSFGHGLSYTTFEFTDLKVKSTVDIISVQVSIRNTGERAGAEVAQAYISADRPSVSRPIKELKGFKKTFLEASHKREIGLQMEVKHATSFWDESRAAWKIEEGNYTVLVGASSQGPFLEAKFEIAKSSWWTGL